MELSGNLLVHTEEIADFASAHTDVTGGNVHIGTYHFIEFQHEGLAEAHDLGIALAARGEIAAAFSTAHGQGGEGVLEGLLKSEELQDAEVYRAVEAQSALVGSDSAVELHAVADVHLNLAFVIHPRHTEGGDALRFHQTLYDFGFLEFRVLVVNVNDRFQDFPYSLKVLCFSWVLEFQLLHNFFNVHNRFYFS